MPLIGPPILRECIQSQSQSPSPSPNPASKQNPCTELFLVVNPESVPENLSKLVQESWQYDPLTTLRLISYLRSLGMSGCFNPGFYVSALWLYQNHPLTLSCNLRDFATFGSLRDFAHILNTLVVNGQNSSSSSSSSSSSMTDSDIARRAVTKYLNDSTYRFFHDRVSDLFADLLKSDVQSLLSGNLDLLSYASLDCPSIDSSIDRNTLLCESIANKGFPKSGGCTMSVGEGHY